MDDLDHGRPPTPSHHPTAGVRILREEIDSIIKFGFPDSDLVYFTRLPSGSSFNNRVYFLTLRHPDAKASPGIAERAEQELVLKVNGRFFGADKVQNEVSCLRILEKYCPDIPSPRALAWSDDGTAATFATHHRTGSYALDVPNGPEKREHGGWILMTRLPGNPLVTIGLGDATLMDLGKQLGDIVSDWRLGVPASTYCGNISLPSHAFEDTATPVVDRSTIHSLLHADIHETEPIINVNEYYRIRLMKLLSTLQTSDIYARNRSLVEPLREFIRDVLPNLKLSDDKHTTTGSFILTHYDLAPRNLLVSGQPPRITGIVDWEFAGFFPLLEEYLNDFINNKGDWPLVLYDTYLDRLEENGVTAPGRNLDPDVWNRNFRLEALAARLAPWYLPGGYKGEDLERQMNLAETDARNMLQKLTHTEENEELPIQYGDNVVFTP